MISHQGSPLAAGSVLGNPDRPGSAARTGAKLAKTTPMERASVANPWNLELIEDLYARWKTDPASVERSWQTFFEGYDLGRETSDAPGGAVDLDAARAQAAVTRLIDAYREYGHYLADLDPLKLTPRRQSHELLELSAFGLSETDLDRVFYNRLCEEI